MLFVIIKKDFYWSSLFINISNTILENPKGLYNNCLFRNLDLDFRRKTINKLYTILIPVQQFFIPVQQFARINTILANGFYKYIKLTRVILIYLE